MCCFEPPRAPIPHDLQVLRSPEFFSLSITKTELSVVLATSDIDESLSSQLTAREGGWRAIGVVGPLQFELVGILAGLAGALADAKISIFAISTYDTDYILLKENTLAAACEVLRGVGHKVVHL